MTEQNYQELQENIVERTEEIKQRACEIEEQVSANVNELMNNTAEKLEQVAEKMSCASTFFRENDVDKIKENVSSMVKNHPGKSLLGALVFGCIVNKILFK